MIWRKSGKSPGVVSNQEQVPRSSAQTIVSQYKVYGTDVLIPQSGRKCKLSTAAERKLLRMVNSQPKTNKKQVCNELNAAGRWVSVSTVTVHGIFSPVP